ncbi:MAG: N-formylglutamate amidohydrolase [Sphingomonadales bacterium]|jgi:N-formylglutamate amidohydrolase
MPEKHDKAPVEILRPKSWTAPCVFISPHSGRYYPKHFIEQSQLDALTLRRSEDAFVDELFACARDYGAPLIHAVYPRAYLDLNRGPEELDPRMYKQPLSGLGISLSERVKAGLGTIPRVVAAGLHIYGMPLELEDAEGRLNDIYRPFHTTLEKLRSECHDRHGFALMIDCHSMPSSVFQNQRHVKHNAVDVVIGDRFGTSCNPLISDWIENKLNTLGLRTVRNAPYAGGYNTRVYGEPDLNIHSIQLEIARPLYMDETKIEKTQNFDGLKAKLQQFSSDLCAQSKAWARSRPAISEAAE